MGSCAVSERKIDRDWKPKIRNDLFFNDLFAMGDEGYCVVGCLENDSQLIVKKNKIDAFRDLLNQFDGTYTIEELAQVSGQEIEELNKVVKLCYDKGFFLEQTEIERFNEVERLSLKVFRHNFGEFSEDIRKKCAKSISVFRILFAVLFVFSLYMVITHADMFHEMTIRTAVSLHGNKWISVILGYIVIQGLSILMGIMHEIAHVIVSLKNQGRPGYIAFVLYMGFMPMAYVKQKNIYALKKKSILEILFAGVIMNFFLFMCFGDLYLYTGNDLCKLLAVTNLRLAIINLVPFSLTDGYYIFSILSRKPNLRMNFFRLLAYPKKILSCDKKIICCYAIYLLTIFVCFNLEVIVLLNILINQFQGAWYWILVPINIMYMLMLHRINLRKMKNKKGMSVR